MPGPAQNETFPAIVEAQGAPGPVLLVCEHASNAIPAEYGTLGLGEDLRQAHIAWDPGALGLARGLARRLGAGLVHAPVSRLVYDCNRPPDAAGAMAERSEMHPVPGNAGLTAAARARRVAAVYLPFHDALHAEIARRLTLGPAPVIVTIHSFTPVWFGVPRAVEFGVIHDADPRLAEAVLGEARATLGLTCEMNAPYSAADDVTHTLKLQALPYGLLNVMLELRNDLIATEAAQEDMADRLAPVLARAVARLRG
ncbi:MAG: N-formylglutamate amidohydrolase [Rhodobacteraceae bacterium]|nr:N-formylglutamate amidohydrolase [Paracoccaceae bacterium]